MSAVKRWTMKVAFSSPSKQPHTRAVAFTEGEWVKWEDHQKALINNVHYIGQLGEQSAEIAHLKAEVEQLQKLVGMQKSIDESIDAWIESKRNAAKEGKPSV